METRSDRKLNLPRLAYDHLSQALAQAAFELAADPAIHGVALFGPVTYLRSYPPSTPLWLDCDRAGEPPQGMRVWQFEAARVHAHLKGPTPPETAFRDRPPLATCHLILDETGELAKRAAVHGEALEAGPRPPAPERLRYTRSSVSLKVHEARGFAGDLGLLRACLAPALLESYAVAFLLRGLWPVPAREMVYALSEQAPDLYVEFRRVLTEEDGETALHLAAEACERHLAGAGGLTRPGERLWL